MTTKTMSDVQLAVRATIDETFTREVIKVPLAGPDNMPSPHYGLCFDDAEGRDDWMSPTVKKGYIPHTKEDVSMLAETVAAGLDLGLEDVQISCFFKPHRGHRVAVQPTKSYRKALCSNELDTMWPKFIINANYGGSFTAQCGMYRDACSNMQMMRRVEHTTVHLRHVGNFRENFDDTVQQWRSLATRFDSIMEVANNLKETKVRAADFYSALYPAPSEADTVAKHNRHKTKLESMMARLLKERDQLLEPSNDVVRCNLWELVNSVTGWVQHDKRKTKDGNKLSEVEKSFLGVADRESDKAWDYAFDNSMLSV